MPARRLSGATDVSQEEVVIRRAALSDWPAIETFLGSTYGPLAAFKGAGRWHWQFVDNPVRTAISTAPSVWIAVHGEIVVGQIAVQAGLFWLDQEERPGGWIVDVMILPAYRGYKLGHRLYGAVAAEVPLLLMLTMAPATRRMALRAGAATLNTATQYSRWTRFVASDIRRYVTQKTLYRPRLGRAARLAFGSLRLHFAAAAALNAVLTMRSWRRPTPVRNCLVEEAELTDVDFDAFWLQVKNRVEAAAVRNTAYMVWRFQKIPDLHYRCFVARRNGAMVGYSILRFTEPCEQRFGIISDLLALPGDLEAGRALIGHAIGFFGRAVCSVESVTSLPEHGELYRKFGFLPTRTTRSTCSRGLSDSPTGGDHDETLWLFTKSDHDWDQIQVA
jgi:GNAT superfamily N-acetyltransferase